MEVQEVKEQLKEIFRQVINNDKWITIHPNGEDGKGRPMLLKDGETPKEAIERTYGKDEKKEDTKPDIKENRKTQHNYGKKVIHKETGEKGIITGSVPTGEDYQGNKTYKYEVKWDNGEIERLSGEKINVSEEKEQPGKGEKSDTKDGEEKKSTFKPAKGIMQSLKDDYEAGKINAKEVAKELSKANLTPYLLDDNEALEKIGVKQSDSKGEKANKYRSKFSDIQNLVGSITPGEQFFDSKIRMAEKRLNDKLEAWEKDYEKETKPAVKQMKKRNIETVKEELKQINKLKADNSKEQDMALLEEIKKLITRVENGKESDMEEKIKNEKVDKRDIIRQIMAIAGKEEASEDVKTIAKLAEKLAYDKSEAGTADNKKVKNEEDKKEEVENKKCKNEDEEDKEKVEELEEEIKEDVGNKKVKNSKEESCFEKINAIYNSIKQIQNESKYTSRQDKLDAAKEYFS